MQVMKKVVLAVMYALLIVSSIVQSICNTHLHRYGMGANGVAQELGIQIGEAKRQVAKFFQHFPGVKDFIEQTHKQVHRTGFVSTLGNRKRFFETKATSAKQPNWDQKGYLERQSVNTIIQGSAADIMKQAMLKISSFLRASDLGDNCRLCLQIHDELLFEVEHDVLDDAIRAIVDCMEHAVALSVPLPCTVSVGRTWGSLESQPKPTQPTTIESPMLSSGSGNRQPQPVCMVPENLQPESSRFAASTSSNSMSPAGLDHDISISREDSLLHASLSQQPAIRTASAPPGASPVICGKFVSRTGSQASQQGLGGNSGKVPPSKVQPPSFSLFDDDSDEDWLA